MSKREFIEHLVISFFVVVTCVNLVMAFLGMRYEPEIRFGYQAFLLPVIYGGLGILPSAVTYRRNHGQHRIFHRKNGLGGTAALYVSDSDYQSGGGGSLVVCCRQKGEGHERGVKAFSKQKDGELRGGPLLSVFLIPEP